MKDAMVKHTDADVMVTFASLRSAYESTMETLQFPQIRTIAIIAEGIPENMTRKMILMAQRKNVTIIGPATVGGVKPGCFKIGNTGGMMDNILHSKLYRSGRYRVCVYVCVHDGSKLMVKRTNYYFQYRLCFAFRWYVQ